MDFHCYLQQNIDEAVDRFQSYQYWTMYRSFLRWLDGWIAYHLHLDGNSLDPVIEYAIDSLSHQVEQHRQTIDPLQLMWMKVSQYLTEYFYLDQ